MYNIYTFNKEQLARQKEIKQKTKEAALKEKHIRQRDKMVFNHRNRIKKFVLDLVKKPIFIEDVIMHDNKFYNSDDKRYRNQSASPQKFIFNRFLTDKERIKQLELTKKEESQKIIKYKTLSEERKARKYEQPTMRFKHRTQLERIVDQLNHYNYNEQHNFILKKQIKRLRKSTVKIPKKHKHKINYSYHTLSSDNEDLSFETVNCLKLGQLQNKNIKQKELLNFHYLKRKEANISMRELMKDYNFHTYFKTAKQIVDLNQMNQSIDNKNQKRQSIAFSQRSESAKTVKFQIPFYFTKNQKSDTPHYNKQRETNEIIPIKSTDKELAKQLFTNKKLISNFTSKYPTSNVTNLDFIKNNPLLYKLSKENESPNSSVISTPKSQEYLYSIMQNPSLFPLQRNKKRLISVSEYYDEADNQKKGANDMKGDDYEKIMIDNEVISINQIDTITKKMLTKCGFLRKKSASNNTSLKKGNGKLMVTAGLTVEEFTKKYNV